MLTTILSKIGLPLLIAAAAFSAGMITNQKLAKPPVVEIPDCICPEQKPCNGIDFDKIKSRQLTIQNQQYLTVSGDSLFTKTLVDQLRKELQAVRLARCK